jgi:hypothetical protein
VEAHRRIGARLARGDEHLPFVAHAYPMRAFSGRPLESQGRNVIRLIFQSDDSSVLAAATWVFREVAEKEKRFAIEIRMGTPLPRSCCHGYPALVGRGLVVAPCGGA